MLTKKAAKASYRVVRASAYALSVCGGVSFALGAVASYQAFHPQKKLFKIVSKLKLRAVERGHGEAEYEYDTNLALAPIRAEAVFVQSSSTKRVALTPSYVFAKNVFEAAAGQAVLSAVNKNEMAPEISIAVEEYEAQEPEESEMDQMALRRLLVNTQPIVPIKTIKHACARRTRDTASQESLLALSRVDIQTEARKPIKPVARVEIPEKKPSLQEKIRSLETQSGLGYSALVAMFNKDDERKSDADPITVQPVKVSDDSGIQSIEEAEPAPMAPPIEMSEPPQATTTVAPEAAPLALLSLASGYSKQSNTQVAQDIQGAQPAAAPVVVLMPVPVAPAVAASPAPQLPQVAQQVAATPAPKNVAAPVLTASATEAMHVDSQESASAASAVTADPATYSLMVTEAFETERNVVSSVNAQILGAPVYARSDTSGMIQFNDVSVSGMLPMILTKDGYLSRRVELRQATSGQAVYQDVKMISRNTAQMLGDAVGQTYRDNLAVVAGEVIAADGSTLPGMQVRLMSFDGATTFNANYFSDAGAPVPQYVVTSANGKFVIMNVTPGTYMMLIQDAQKNDYAARIVHVASGEGLYRFFSVGEPMNIVGRLMSASANTPVRGAEVQLLGQVASVRTRKNGTFSFGPVYVDCNELNYLQIDKAGYYRNRVDYACDSKARDFYVAPKSPIDGDALDAGVRPAENTGVIFGHVSSKVSVRMQLWGADETSAPSASRGEDFYYSNDGVLKPELDSTTQSGRFTFFDVPEGLSYIQAVTKDGQSTISYWPILISPLTVNVYAQ